MRQRAVVAGLAAAGLFAAGAASLIPHAVVASVLCDAVTATAVSPQSAAPGQTVTITGSGFTNGAQNCNVSVSVGSGGGAKTTAGTVVSDSQVTFAAVDGMFGNVSVTVTPPVGSGSVTVSSNRNLYIIPTVTAASPATPTEQQQMTVSGARFQLGGLLTSVSGMFFNGTAPCQTIAATAASDTTVTLAAPSTYCSGELHLTFTAPASGSSGAVSMTVNAPGTVSISPSVSSFPTSAPAGTQAPAHGSGFGPTGSLTGGTFTLVQWTDTTIVVGVPADAVSAPLALIRSDGVAVHNGPLTVPVVVSSVAPSSVVVGDAVTISGSGFGPTAKPGSVSVGATNMQTTWSPTSITFTVPAGVATGAVKVGRSDAAVASAMPILTVLPKITGITPTHATQGSLVEVTGTTFGTQQGSVSVGGQAATVTLWGDQQVLVNLPNLPPGPATVTLTVPGAPSALTIGVTIDPGATPGAGGSGSGSGSGSGASPAPLITPNPSGPVVSPGASVPFDKPKQSGPVQLNLSTPSDNAAPGSDVPFTLTLAAFGNPLVGAPVELVMVVEPGTDASITPSTGVTDATGKLTGTIHLSKTAGDHIVLARSGQYSDEIRVVGNGDGAVGSSGAAGSDGASGGGIEPSQRLIIAGALVLCLVLFLVGFVIQIKHAGGVGRKRRSRDAETAAVPTTPPQA